MEVLQLLQMYSRCNKVKCRKHVGSWVFNWVVLPMVLRSAWPFWGTLIYKGRLGVMLVKVVVLRPIIFHSNGATRGRLGFTDDCEWPCRSGVTSKCLNKFIQLPLLWLQALQVQLSVNPQTIWYPTGDIELLIHVYACVCFTWRVFFSGFKWTSFLLLDQKCTALWPHHLSDNDQTASYKLDFPWGLEWSKIWTYSLRHHPTDI